jgi:hypothetical protein
LAQACIRKLRKEALTQDPLENRRQTGSLVLRQVRVNLVWIALRFSAAEGAAPKRRQVRSWDRDISDSCKATDFLLSFSLYARVTVSAPPAPAIFSLPLRCRPYAQTGYPVPMPLRTIAAARYVTPLREGGSMPAVVEADDQGMYVLKFRGAGQGPKALVAELVAGGIARTLGLPVPEIVLAELDPELARTEGDPEIQHLIRASAGLNLALDYLPGAVNFDPDPTWPRRSSGSTPTSATSTVPGAIPIC